jgi:hypothetical protein
MLIKRTIEVDYTEKDKLVVPYRIGHSSIQKASQHLLESNLYLSNYWMICWYTYQDRAAIDTNFMRLAATTADLNLVPLDVMANPDVFVFGNLVKTLTDDDLIGRERQSFLLTKVYITEVDFYSLCYRKIHLEQGMTPFLDTILEGISYLHGNRTEIRRGMPLSVVRTYA